jgi:hypothetical protein
LVAFGAGGTPSQGVFGAIKVFGAADEGLMGPPQLLMGLRLDHPHTFVQALGTLVKSPFSVVQNCFSFIRSPFTLVGQLFSTIGEFLAAVGRTVPLIGDLFAVVGRKVPLISKHIAALSRAVLFPPWPYLFRRVLEGGVPIRWSSHPITVTPARAGVDGEPVPQTCPQSTLASRQELAQFDLAGASTK